MPANPSWVELLLHRVPWLIILVLLLMVAGRLLRWLARGGSAGAAAERDEATETGTCGACGYAVRGLQSWTCPECGADLQRVGVKPATRDSRRREKVGFALMAVCLLIVLCLAWGVHSWTRVASPPPPPTPTQPTPAPTVSP